MHLKKAVVIIDANKAIEAGGLDVLERHAEYGKQLLAISQGQIHLVIVGSSKLFELASCRTFESLTVLGPKTGSIINVIPWVKIKQILTNNSISPKLFVVGDPWKSGLAGLVIKFRGCKDIPFQLQIHADFCAPRWKYQSFGYFLKYLIGRFTVSKYFYLRLVSKAQERNMNLGSTHQIDVIPVNFYRSGVNFGANKKTKTFTFGFFGRLHKDRGTERLIYIFNRILSQDKQVNIIIGGDGPEMSEVRNRLENNFPNQVRILGNIQGNKVEPFWSEIDVLISLAPFESFGRALRESLLMSIPVIALPTSGAIDLQASAGPSWVELINPDDSPQIILEKSMALARIVHRDPLPEELVNQVSLSEQLAQSWLRIIG